MRLMLVEDDAQLRETLVRSLSRRGLQVVAFAAGEPALAWWRAHAPDVVALDLSLPDRDGLLILQDARAGGLRTPVLLLTARSAVGDRVLGLNTGADDYLTKPFDLDELEARLRALARRHGSANAATSSDMAALVEWRLDRSNGALYHQGQAVDMPSREARMMRLLMTHPGRAVSKEQLFEHVFAGEQDVHIEAVEVVAYRLRKRLHGSAVQLVTLRGLGYLLKAEGA